MLCKQEFESTDKQCEDDDDDNNNNNNNFLKEEKMHHAPSSVPGVLDFNRLIFPPPHATNQMCIRDREEL